MTTSNSARPSAWAFLFAALMLLAVSKVWAGQDHGGHPPPKPTGGQTTVTVGDSSKSDSSSESSAKSASKSSSSATGGKASASQSQTADGGAGGSASQAQKQQQDASNKGNTQVTQNTYPQQNPGAYAPPVLVSGCGIGASGGGATPKGAGALGIEFTTDQCYDVIMAAQYDAAGDHQSACELRKSSKAVRNAIKRGAKMTDCALFEQRVVERLVEVPVGVTEAEAADRAQRAVADYIRSHPQQACQSDARPKAAKHRKARNCREGGA